MQEKHELPLSQLSKDCGAVFKLAQKIHQEFDSKNYALIQQIEKLIPNARFTLKQHGKAYRNINLDSINKSFAIIEESYINILDQLKAIQNQANDLDVFLSKKADGLVGKNSMKRKNKKKKMAVEIEDSQEKIETDPQELQLHNFQCWLNFLKSSAKKPLIFGQQLIDFSILD